MYNIKFGTDGWRAIIAQDYTIDNVKRVAYATAQWVKQSGKKPQIILGYDCRFAGPLFAENVIEVMCSEGVSVIFDKQFVSTPMVSLACKHFDCFAGVILTASHNPPSYNGYKLKSYYGGPTVPAEITAVENLIPNNLVNNEPKGLAYWEEQGLLSYENFEDLYYNHVVKHFDIDTIKNANLNIAYDAMYGAGQNIFKRLLPNAKVLHGIHNPGFDGQAPEPIAKNLTEFSEYIKNNKVDFGLATDGDADRIGVLDTDGSFVDAHHIILLLIHILAKYKGLKGKVVAAFSVTPRVKTLCKHYGLEVQTTKVGFKHISGIMVTEDVLLGGEESGGIAVKGHIPERDGIWDGLILLEHLAKTGKTLRQLIEEVYEIVGPFFYNRNDMHITNALKVKAIENCKNGVFTSFGKFEIDHVEDIDGYKFHLKGGRTLMFRASGTEPVLRVYAEGENEATVTEMLAIAAEMVLNG